MTPLRFLTNEPVLLVGKSLIIADLHLGIEYEYYQSGIKIPSQTEKIKKKLNNLIKTTRAKKLIILGDVKHKVPGSSFQEEREIPEFFDYFLKKIDIEVLPGNHDADLPQLIPQIKIHPSKGILVKNCYLSHGHTWPSKEFLRADYIIIGHDHPIIEFRNKLGYRWIEPAWMRAEFNKKIISEKYKIKTPPKMPELIIVPAFNEFAGGIAFNKTEKTPGLSPLSKTAELKEARIYLLDGTFLGLLKNL